jgi:hypothetical protein
VIIRPLLLIILIHASLLCQAQGKWVLTKDVDGIKVYTRLLSTGKFKEVKVNFELSATENQLISVLQDIPHHKDWSYGTKHTYLINKKGKDTLIYYSEVALPWPLSNRDLVIELSFKNDTVNNMLHIRAKSIPGIMPVKSGLVRVPSSLATWDVTVLSPHLLRIEYILSADPGGALPAWLVNLSASVGPYNSFTKLRNIIGKQNVN